MFGLQDRALGHPDLAVARRAVEATPKGHAPNPALAVDRHWMLVAANDAMRPLLTALAPFSAPEPTCCGSACTPRASHPASVIVAIGAGTSRPASPGRSRLSPTRC